MSSPTYSHPGLGARDAAALLGRAGFDVGPMRRSRRTLLDTFDGRLHAADLRLEFRDDDRRELILAEGGSPRAHVAVENAPTFVADLPRGPFGARLAPVIEVRALLPIVTVTGQRSVAVRRDAHGKTEVAIVVQDRLAVDGTVLTSPSWVAEVDDLEGYARAGRRANELLVTLGLSACDADVIDLAAAAAGVDLQGFDGSPTVTLDPGEAAGDGFRRVLAKLADHLDANWTGAVADVDPEFLHDLRVAIRRTRSVLAEGKRVLAATPQAHFQQEFAWLGAATGPARDLDVHVIGWDASIASLGARVKPSLAPVLDHISDRRRAEHATLAGILRSDRYRDLIGEWRTWLAAPAAGETNGVSDRPLGRVVADRVAASQRRLLKGGRGIGAGSTAADLHVLRKDAKKLRYLLECFGGLFAAKPRRAFVHRLKALQDNLGEHQDTEVHAEQLLALSQEMPPNNETTADTLLAVGRLTELLDRRRGAARDDFAHRFSEYDSKQTRRAMDELLRSASGR